MLFLAGLMGALASGLLLVPNDSHGAEHDEDDIDPQDEAEDADDREDMLDVAEGSDAPTATGTDPVGPSSAAGSSAPGTTTLEEAPPPDRLAAESGGVDRPALLPDPDGAGPEHDLLPGTYLTDDLGGSTTDTPHVDQDARFGDGSANDLRGGQHGDLLIGDGGDDTLTGGAGRDVLSGGDGEDRLDGGIGRDELWGDGGGDLLRGGNGDDFLAGGDGDDLLKGGAGDDRLFGQVGDDTLDGGRGNDVLDGSAVDSRGETDVLDGGHGNDTLAGDGADRLTGGSGADRFLFRADGSSEGPSDRAENEVPLITDFEPGIDVIEITWADPGGEDPAVEMRPSGDGTDIVLNGRVVAHVADQQGMSAEGIVIHSAP